MEGAVGRSPSPEWLRTLLAAERADVARYLEHRHGLLVAELAGEAVGDEPGLPVKAPISMTSDAGLELLAAKSAAPADCVGGDEPEACGTPFAQEDCARADDDDVARVASRRQPDLLRQPTCDVTDIHKILGVAQAANAWGSGPFTYTLVTKSWFEGGIAAIIVLNVFVMAAQIQYRSFDLGRTIGYRWHDETKEELWAHADVVFNVLDFVFGVIYIAEFLLKVHAFRSVWIKDPWNWFDALIVGFWVVEKQMQDVVQLPGNVTLLRTARLFKLLRLVKVIKTIHGFESLALLLTTLRACVKILAWSSTLLFSFQVLIAFVIFFVLEETYFLQPGVTFEEQRQVFEYFGSFSRVMLSMFEMTLANWPPVCRLLVENINEWFMIFFVTHKLIIGFAVIGVINGVFMQETLKVASSDDAIMMRTKEQEVNTYSRKIKRLFYAADASHDGKIDVQEFLEIVADPQILTWLSSMDLPVRDPELLFNLLDSEGCGKISMEVLIKNALKLRGSAKSVDVLGLKKQLDAIQNSLALAMDGKVHA